MADKQPDGNAESSFRADISFPALMVTCGVSLMLFGTRYPRAFGLAYLCIGLALFAEPWYRLALSRYRDSEISTTLRRFIHRALSIMAGSRLRWILGAISVMLIASAMGLWRNAAFPIPQFFLALGVTSLVWATAGHRCIALLERSRSTRAIFTLVCAVAGLAAPIALLTLVVMFGTNVPFLDEQGPTLHFVREFPNQSWDERMAELVNLHLDHRIATTRLAALGQYKLEGDLNFYHLSIFSNCLLITAALILVLTLDPGVRSPALAAPFLLLLFQPQYFQLSLWAFSLPHFSVVLFGVLMFWTLTWKTWFGLGLGIVFAILGAYSFATGVLLPLLGLLFLVNQRRARHATFWLLPSTILVIRYFDGLTQMYSRAMRNIGMLEVDVSSKVSYFFEFLGAFITVGAYADVVGVRNAGVGISSSAEWAARTAGVLVSIGFVYVSTRGYWRRNPTVYGMLTILFISALLTSYERSQIATIPEEFQTELNESILDREGGFRIAPAYLSRYAINSSLFIALLYLAFLELHPSAFKRNRVFVVAAAALFSVGSFLAALPLVRAHSATVRLSGLVASNAIFQHADPPGGPIPHFSIEEVRKTVEAGVYLLPVHQIVDTFRTPVSAVARHETVVGETSLELVRVGENEFAYTIVLRDSLSGSTDSPGTPGVVLFRSGQGELYEATPLSAFPGGGVPIRNSYGVEATHLCVVAKSDLDTGRSGIALARVNEGTVQLHDTGVRLPTVFLERSLLRETTSRDIMHVLGRGLRSVWSPDGRWNIVDFESPQAIVLPPEVSIETVTRLNTESESSTPIDAWILGSDSHSGTSLRLTIGREGAALRMRTDGRWHGISQMPVTPGVWIRNCVVVDGDEVVHSLQEVSATADGTIHQTAGRIPNAIGGEPSTLSVFQARSAEQIPLVELREVRVTEGDVSALQ